MNIYKFIKENINELNNCKDKDNIYLLIDKIIENNLMYFSFLDTKIFANPQIRIFYGSIIFSISFHKNILSFSSLNISTERYFFKGKISKSSGFEGINIYKFYNHLMDIYCER